ncbi:MAG: DUF2298 domain-containing protein, partial [Candidatus Aureabacteria bacterium]|nr:DUF2298 domain-containing protein [Candidatus Auribacterota bacterium]
MTVLRWLCTIEILYVAGWPLCALLFGSLPDGGLGVARLLGILLVSYAAWLSASVGLFPYDGASLAAFLALYLVLNAFILTARPREIAGFLRERKKIMVFEELFFIVLFAVALFIQSYKPDITLAEKEPDMMYLQAVLRGGAMPPEDLWFAGQPVNYYYLGYVVVASLIRLAGARPEVGFNLAAASVVALGCLGSFSLAYNLLRRRGIALLAPLFLMGLGNLDAAFRAFRMGSLFRVDWWYEMFSHGSREIIPGTI